MLIQPDSRAATVLNGETRPASLRTVDTPDGPQLFLSAGRAFLRVEVSLPGGAEVLFRQIKLTEDLKVAFSIPAKQESETVTVVQDSDKRQEAVKVWKSEHDHMDGDAIIASREAIRREDVFLAQMLVSGLDGIDPTTVTRAEITLKENR